MLEPVSPCTSPWRECTCSVWLQPLPGRHQAGEASSMWTHVINCWLDLQLSCFAAVHRWYTLTESSFGKEQRGFALFLGWWWPEEWSFLNTVGNSQRHSYQSVSDDRATNSHSLMYVWLSCDIQQVMDSQCVTVFALIAQIYKSVIWVCVDTCVYI